MLPERDFGFARTSKLVIFSQEQGYSMSTRIRFADPIGNGVWIYKDVPGQVIKRSAREVKLNLDRLGADPKELAKDIKRVLSLIEEAVNYACIHREKEIYDEFVVDIARISEHIRKSQIEQEMRLRGEKIEPFKDVHVNSDIIIENGFVPYYIEYDRFDLFGANKTFRPLPKEFVDKLLKCQGPTMLPEETFNEKEREVLDIMVKKNQLKREKILGKFNYLALGDKTKRYFVKALWKMRSQDSIP